MDLCWDNIENIRLTKSGNFRDIVRGITYYLKKCSVCGNVFLGRRNSNFCSKSCSNSNRVLSDATKERIRQSNLGKRSKQKGKKLSEKTKSLISLHHANVSGSNNPMYGRKRSERVKEIISKANKGENSIFWKGGYSSKGIPTYDTYAPQLDWCEEVRRNEEDPNILEVKCTHCGNWFIPKLHSVRNRLNLLNNIKGFSGEHRFYCSDHCRIVCPLYHKSPNQLMKEDAIRVGRLSWLDLGREVQSELRQMVLERDENKCTKCGATEDLHCHHILPVEIYPIESADIDNCVTLCYTCHKEVHKSDGCRYGQIRVETC